MPIRALGSCLLLLGVFQPGRIAVAQVTTGSLRGTVIDESGASRPRVTAILTSPALLGGTSTSETNDEGQFRFLGLTPGLYGLEIRADGFASYQEEGLRIQVGRTLERNFTLKLESYAESIVVIGESPRPTRESPESAPTTTR